MTIEETLKIMSQAIRNYTSELGNKFSLLEYYSLTDIKPVEMARIANNKKMYSVAINIAKFNKRNLWNMAELKIGETIRLYHCINSKELTENDKILIIQTLKDEGYPLCEGVYNVAARYYVNFGIESILKENVRKKVLGRVLENYSEQSQTKKLVK